MFETYKKKVNQIEKFYNQGDTENTILGCGKLIEHIVSVLFSEFHNSSSCNYPEIATFSGKRVSCI